MTLQDILDWANVRIAKEQRGGAFSPEQYNTALMFLNVEVFKKEYGLPEQYRPGEPLPAITYEITQKIIDDMRLIKVRMDGSDGPPLMIDQNGVASVPEDYIHRTAIRYQYILPGRDPEMTEVDVVTDGEWASRLGNSITRPTKQNPCCTFYGKKIQFEPRDLVAVEFVYLRLPVTPVYDYYFKADGQITYLPPGTSHLLASGEIGSAGQTAGATVVSKTVELEWPPDMHPDIANLIYKTMAGNLRDVFAYQDATQRQAKGQ